MEEAQTPPARVTRRWSRVPVGWFLGLSGLNALLWFSADFRSFAPPSEGTFIERFFMFGIAEAGPFAFTLNQMMQGDSVLGPAIAIMVLVSAITFLSARIPRNWGAVLAACVGITIWLFFGSAVAGLRVT
jgi:hypothetical protein